jgi:hypothetical protein
MKTTFVQYRVKPGRATENEAAIRAVFEQLGRDAPSGIRYASFKLADGVTFIHLASVDTADDTNPLGKLAAFQAFVAGVKERCEEPPVAQEVNCIGSYRLFE